jgi:hypothetical protein
MGEPLIGAELLQKTRSMGEASKSEIVRACGYVSTKKQGGERLNFTAFYEALLEAKGLSIGTESPGKRGRRMSYVATVHGNGNLLIGRAYTELMDLAPGDQFRIRIGRKRVSLVPCDEVNGRDAEFDVEDAEPVEAEEEQAELAVA